MKRPRSRRIAHAVTRGTATTFAVLVASVAVGLICRADATPADPTPPPSGQIADVSDQELPTESNILPELGNVPVEGARVSNAVSRLAAMQAQQRAAIERHSNAVATLQRLTARDTVLSKAIDRDTAIKGKADSQITRLTTRLRYLALNSYVGVTDSTSVQAALELDLDRALDAQARHDLSSAITASSVKDLKTQRGIAHAAATRLRANRDERHAVRADAQHNRQVRDEATAETERLERAMVDAKAEVADARSVSLVAGTNLPLVALDAYVRGAAKVNATHPQCAMKWSILAGIGQIESHQGTYGGSRFDERGQVSRPIFGIALDGTGGNERIEVEGGFMRAEGPMQFLPSTWRAVSVDGNDDGKHDIQNIYDAAASAAAYLCRDGRSVATDAGRARAIRAYNNSAVYVADVVAQQQRYERAVPGIPPPAAAG